MRAAVFLLLVACSKREAPVETVKPIDVDTQPAPIVSAAPTVAPSSSTLSMPMPMEITASADAGRPRSGTLSAAKQAEIQKQLEIMNMDMLKTLNSKGSSTERALNSSDVNMTLLGDAYIGDAGHSGGALQQSGSGGAKIVGGGAGLAGIGDTRDH